LKAIEQLPPNRGMRGKQGLTMGGNDYLGTKK
jgi:hypothetical protein